MQGQNHTLDVRVNFSVRVFYRECEAVLGRTKAAWRDHGVEALHLYIFESGDFSTALGAAKNPTTRAPDQNVLFGYVHTSGGVCGG